MVELRVNNRYSQAFNWTGNLISVSEFGIVGAPILFKWLGGHRGTKTLLERRRYSRFADEYLWLAKKELGGRPANGAGVSCDKVICPIYQGLPISAQFEY